MCVSGMMNGSTIEYILESTGIRPTGWMSIGFGSRMSGSPMVILWSNSDGSITLSQRESKGHSMPTVVASPPRMATLSTDLSIASGTQQKFAFSVQTTSSNQQTLIWAYGTGNPGTPDIAAEIEAHQAFGTFTLNLNKADANMTLLYNPALGASRSDPPLVVAHATLCTIGFLLLLPAGALLARYVRTFSAVWYKGHWIFQFALAGPITIVGIVLGAMSVGTANLSHFYDVHQKLGYGLLALYIAQCALGAFIHWVKPKNRRGRPPQNYVHAVLGLATIGISFYQVRTGYATEWMNVTGRTLDGVNIFWWIWIFLLPAAYAIGLAFLPKQWRQERANSRKLADPRESSIDLSNLSLTTPGDSSGTSPNHSALAL
ncbi:hypothetical protein JAAARDRAFT_34380 [Jaapia argillacea MUCL 33604]|uniref:Cytochrome b561 domain-containing protein n=1 Tax=Jaapia argillacea MUCL 33604 TaxID=933084 RepID=A0A067PUR2_9AGAM|nr:hypothetical protein JAAARDRAFT_34380 [Jaapia argillacea MUCL 33604]